MSRVLVTGAGGFIGRHTLAPLLAAGYEVHAVTSRSHPSREVRWHHADLLTNGDPVELIARVRPSHLLHLAWNTKPGVVWTTLDNLDWVRSSLSLLRAFGEAGGRRAVVAGTCAEYAWERDTHCVEGVGLDERGGTPLHPATLYGAAKHGLHMVARAWAQERGVALAWGRIFYVYGPYEYPDRLVSAVTRALLRGEEARCTHGRQVRDLLYSPELGAALAALLDKEVTGPVNLASGKAVSLAEVVRLVARVVDRPELVRLGVLPASPKEPEKLTADVRRLREDVGFQSSVELREGIERTVAWWRQALSAPAVRRGVV
jgi:nucleoside-diphosphate-sugar epimerase